MHAVKIVSLHNCHVLGFFFLQFLGQFCSKFLPLQVLDKSSGICLYLHAGFENTFLSYTESSDMSALGPTTSVFCVCCTCVRELCKVHTDFVTLIYEHPEKEFLMV